MLRLILGAAGSGKTAFIMEEIKERVAAQKAGAIVLIPEQYSHEAERELCSSCGDSVSLYAEVLSFSRLAVRVSQEAGTGGAVSLDKGGRLLTIALTMDQIKGQLTAYGRDAGRPELQESLLAMVDELKAACIEPEDLRAVAGDENSQLSMKLLDLALCLETYNALLSLGSADPADRLRRLADTIGETSLKNYSYYIDGFTDFTGAESAVIDSLLRLDANLTVCLTCEDLYGDSEHFMPARRAALSLLSLAEKHSSKKSILEFTASSEKRLELQFFKDNLFRYTSEVMDAGEAISLHRCGSISDECELAASLCIQLVREGGCRYRDIAIAARGFEDYSAPLGRAFRLYGLPLFLAKSDSILKRPLPAFISTAFDVINGGWDSEDVLAYIKTGLTGIEREGLSQLESYVLLWDIKGSAWKKKGNWTQHPDGFALEFDEDSRNALLEIDSLRRRLAAPLIRLEQRSETAFTGGEQVQALSDFLEETGLPATLQQRSVALEEEGFAQDSAEYSQLWEILVSSMEQFYALLGELPMTRENFSRLFLRMLSKYDVSVIPLSADSISAGDLDRMRRRRLKHLIILGVSDDRLPMLSGGEGLFSPEERDELQHLGLSLGGNSEDRLCREFSLIYNCVSLPSDTLNISYCFTDSSGAPAREGLLIKRAKLLFGLKPALFDRATARLSAPSPAFLEAISPAGRPSGRLAEEYFSMTDKGKARMDELRSRASADRGSLSKEATQALYGKTPGVSPSRADALFSCRFLYFLRYGLRLNDREKAGLDPRELGSFTHYVLENVMSEISASGGFAGFPPERTAVLAEKYMDLYVREKLGNMEDKSPRFVYLFNRLRPSLRKISIDMAQELALSDFEPFAFELSFAKDGDLPPLHVKDGDTELNFSGIADRVDGCFRDGKLYLRVVDYKTGKKSFSLSDIWNGIGMQMLLYLFTLETEGSFSNGVPVIPAGVLYAPARDILISADGDMDDETLNAERSKRLRRSGLILDDPELISAMEHGGGARYLPVKYRKDGTPAGDGIASTEQFSRLKAHVEGKLLELARCISEGNISPDPYYLGESDNACMYCPYEGICRFDEERDKRRYLSKLKADEFWQKLEEKQ